MAALGKPDRHHCPTHLWCHLCRCRRDCRYTRPPSPPQDSWVTRWHLKKSRSTFILTVLLFYVIKSNFQSHINPNQVLNMLSLGLSDWFLKKEIQSTMAINYRITSTCLNEYWVHLKFGRHKVRTLRGQGRFPAQGELKNYRAKYATQYFFHYLLWWWWLVWPVWKLKAILEYIDPGEETR